MNSWEVTDSNGAVHNISHNIKGGKNVITVDGETYKVKSSNWFINLIDYSIELPGAVCNLVVIGRKADLAVNGIYKSNGNAYEPVSNMPAWIWVLVALSVIGGWFFGGLLCCFIGCLLSILYVQFGLQKKNGAVIGIFIGFLAILVVFFGLNLMMAGY